MTGPTKIIGKVTKKQKSGGRIRVYNKISYLSKGGKIGKTKIEKYTIPISPLLSSKQKGEAAEGRISELISLYGSPSLSCYRPVSDDDGIDFIVKEKNKFKCLFLQVKSRFGYFYQYDRNKGQRKSSFTITIKQKRVKVNSPVLLIVCYFNFKEGDIDDRLWLIPTSDIAKTGKLKNGKYILSFGLVGDGHKLKEYALPKRLLASELLKKLKND